MNIYRLIFLTVLFFPVLLLAQVSEDAQKLYNEGEYFQAKKSLEKDLEKDPANPSINFLLGMASLKTGDLLTAEKTLTLAKSKKNQDATLYLGRLYAMQYKFKEAEKQFEAYQKAMRRNKEALAELDLEREYADKLARLVNRTEDIQIIDSVVLSKSEFLNAYNLSVSGGSIEWAQDFFDDGWNGENSVVFMNERKTKIYFSRSATEQGETLYTMEKLFDNFGNEKMLPSPVTDNHDQAFPFIMTDGLTIYFATKGHESIGGYDLYASRYNLNSNTYLTPNQMNMPFNSPFNDYMLVIDEVKGIGWFASDRYQPEGQVCVYTFIPNQEVLLVQSEDVNQLANRAKINSIGDTWRKDKNYSDILELASTKNIKDADKSFDFEFVINDENTYHQLSDFKSFSARELFIKAMEIKEKFDKLIDELKEKRNQYVSASSDNKNSIAVEILRKEKMSEELFKELKRTEIHSRNEEVRHINVLK
ncbi:MAG: tetratricopeptide repeat protein [Candidatus Saccharimonadaceae bacterium]